MSKALFKLVGPLLHTVDRKNLEETGAILVPRLARIPTQFSYTFNNDYAKMISRLTEDYRRNALVAGHVITEFKRFKEPIMVVSDRVAHCEALEYLINQEPGVKAIVLHGKIEKKIRKQAVEDLRKGKYNILIAPVQLLGEGFDSPNLNALFLTTPVRFSGRLLQVIGRILRPSKGGAPRVYDFRDNLVGVLKNSGFGRDSIYKKFGWTS